MTSLLLSLVFSAALVANVATQKCRTVQPTNGMDPYYFSLEESNFFTLWFRPLALNDVKEWAVSFKFGFGEDSTRFISTYQLELKKIKKKNFFTYKFTKTGGVGEYLDQRVSQAWLESAEWVGVSLQQTLFTLVFNNNGSQLHIKLKDQQLGSVETVEIKSDLDIGENCYILEEHTTTAATTTSTTTTTTTTPPTTTTTVATTTAATTTEPTTTEPYVDSTTVSHDQETTTWMLITDTSEDEGNVTTGPDTEKITHNEECRKIPLWVWVCVGLMGSFFLFFVVLLIYTIVLCRRNWFLEAAVARQGQHLRGRIPSPGGYGEEARDMHYYGIRNQNLMIGGTTPRIRTPSPRQPSHRFDTDPKTLPCRRSLSHPGSTYFPPTINFPAPPSPFLEEIDHTCTCDSEERTFSEMDSLTGKKTFDISENNLADDERSTSSCNRNSKMI